MNFFRTVAIVLGLSATLHAAEPARTQKALAASLCTSLHEIPANRKQECCGAKPGNLTALCTKELEASLVLFHTGVSRSSAAIIAEQTRNISASTSKPIDAMHQLRSDAFAMKEAVLKVLQVPSTAIVPWHSIEVRTGGNGVPFVVLSGGAAALAERQGIARIDISMSHDAGIALAVAAAIPIPPEEQP